MKASIIVDDTDMRRAVVAYIQRETNITIDPKDVVFKVKSQNNYHKQEWEPGSIRVEFVAPALSVGEEQ
jgi:hypothetical protein